MISSTRCLSDLAIGDTACLVDLDGERSFKRRLMELGMLPGTLIRVIRRAEVGGVLELEVRRSRLSLRMGEARGILVHAVAEPEPDPSR